MKSIRKILYKNKFYVIYFVILAVAYSFLLFKYPITYGIDGGYYPYQINLIKNGNLTVLHRYPISFGIFYLSYMLFNNEFIAVKVPALIAMLLSFLILPSLLPNRFRIRKVRLIIFLTSGFSYGAISLLNGFYKQVLSLPFFLLSILFMEKAIIAKGKFNVLKNVALSLFFAVLCLFSHQPMFLLLLLILLLTLSELIISELIAMKRCRALVCFSLSAVVFIYISIYFLSVNNVPFLHISSIVRLISLPNLISHLRTTLYTPWYLSVAILFFIVVTILISEFYPDNLVVISIVLSFCIAFLFSENDWFWRILYLSYIPISLSLGIFYCKLTDFIHNVKVKHICKDGFAAAISVIFILSFVQASRYIGPYVKYSALSSLHGVLEENSNFDNCQLYSEIGLNYWISYITGYSCGEIKKQGNYYILSGERGRTISEEKPPILILLKRDNTAIIKSSVTNGVKISVYYFSDNKNILKISLESKEKLKVYVKAYLIKLKDQSSSNVVSIFSKGVSLNGSYLISRNLASLNNGKYKLSIGIKKDSEQKFSYANFIIDIDLPIFSVLPNGHVERCKYLPSSKDFQLIKCCQY